MTYWKDLKKTDTVTEKKTVFEVERDGKKDTIYWQGGAEATEAQHALKARAEKDAKK